MLPVKAIKTFKPRELIIIIKPLKSELAMAPHGATAFPFTTSNGSHSSFNEEMDTASPPNCSSFLDLT